MNEEIKLNKRQPTWNYILNDLALYSLMTKVIHSEEATNQEKFDFMYQIELLQQENTQLKDKIEKAIEKIKNIDKDEETLNDDTRIYMIQDVDVYEIERILKEN